MQHLSPLLEDFENSKAAIYRQKQQNVRPIQKAGVISSPVGEKLGFRSLRGCLTEEEKARNRTAAWGCSRRESIAAAAA